MTALHADKILLSECVFTANTLQPFAGAVAIKGDTIIGVGKAEEVARYRGPDTEVLDFGDATILPGFNDSHVHFSQAATTWDPDFCIPLFDCLTKNQCIERIADFAAAHPDSPWVYGFGWGATAPWELETPPTAADLDAIDAVRPICMVHFTGHNIWCNSRALELAGIDCGTPDPEGGEIVRDADGNPTGFLVEEASHPVGALALNVPNLASSLRKLMATFVSQGITSVGDVFPREVSNDVYATYGEMERKGDMLLRVTFFPSLLDVDEVAGLRDTYCSDWVRVGGVKQLMDGILEAGTAWMIDPYVDSDDHFGAPNLTEEQFEHFVMKADAAGLAVRAHCIGDATARMVIDVHERVQRVHGKKGLRHCLEHLETAQASDLERMAALDLCACIQPLHSVYGQNESAYEQYIGDRANHTWRFADMLKMGIHIGISTDFPAAASSNPMDVLQGAMTRALPDGSHVDSYQVDQVLTMGEALQAMTRGSAYVETFEHRVGTLEEGKLADIVVMDRDLFAIEDTLSIHEASPQMTMVGGAVVFQAE